MRIPSLPGFSRRKSIFILRIMAHNPRSAYYFLTYIHLGESTHVCLLACVCVAI